MSDWQHAMHVARRMTVIEWVHGLLSVGFIAATAISIYVLP